MRRGGLMETGAGQEHCPGGSSEVNPGETPGRTDERGPLDLLLFVETVIVVCVLQS